ncbi:polysaccharide deacetylase family protein [Daejeonella sp. H1SJ63]|uniref:polysaccharide deacetylase family protein n=1 Tax=Daejeonella sp. H1SJ63 TaxID=3034145 RepID=UPI0023ECB2D1|nr:polysaccharide deacetylase family protein [Daejeonella sp. H1SJ63]
MYLAKSPFWLQWFYPKLTWHKNRRQKFIYLTFDDGPIPVVTPFVLNTLKKFNAKATFFCIGDNVRKHPDIFSLLEAEGHTVGNHTYNHLKGWKTDNKEYLKNFEECAELTGSRLFRPPYGRIKKSQIKIIKALYPATEIIMWDVLSGDWDQNISPEKCIQNVLKNAKNGSIIVFHDSEKAYGRLEHTLPVVLTVLNEQGFGFKTL